MDVCVCVCVCVVEENGFFVSQKQKRNKYRKKRKWKLFLLFLALEEGEAYFKSMIFFSIHVFVFFKVQVVFSGYEKLEGLQGGEGTSALSYLAVKAGDGAFT